jgi:hypothetical protein
MKIDNMTQNLSSPSPLMADRKTIEFLALSFRNSNEKVMKTSNPEVMIREIGGKQRDDLQGDLIWSVDEKNFYYPPMVFFSIRSRRKQYAMAIGLQVMHAPVFRDQRPGVIMRAKLSDDNLEIVFHEAITFANELILPHKQVLELFDKGGYDAVRCELKCDYSTDKDIDDRVEYARLKNGMGSTQDFTKGLSTSLKYVWHK